MNTGFLGPAVATVLTACGIETHTLVFHFNVVKYVATVLTACGIETLLVYYGKIIRSFVATVLTACGIETLYLRSFKHTFFKVLQQYLPLAVLKHIDPLSFTNRFGGCNSTYRLRY